MQRIESLELLRFLAAFFVVLYHIPTIQVGHFGVDIFFVISGYVMMLSTTNGHAHFFTKRIIRIVPAYWFTTLGVFVIALILPHVLLSTTANPWHLLQSLFFIPFDKNGVGHQPVLAVGWTLNYEMYFYALFLCACHIHHKARGVVTVALLVALLLVFDQFSAFLPQIYSDLILLEFAFGILLYQLMKKNIKETTLIILLISLSALYKQSFDHRIFYFGVPALGSVFVFLWYVAKYPLPRYTTMLGGMSYVLYLTHPYVIRLFDRILPWFQSDVLPLQFTATLIAIAGSLLVAFLFFRYMEAPVIQFLRHRFIHLSSHTAALRTGMRKLRDD